MKPIVKIAWLDACSTAGWQHEPTPPSVNYTIGYEVHHDDEYIQVACTYDPRGGYWTGSVSIPKDNVVTYDVIEEGSDEELEIIFESES